MLHICCVILFLMNTPLREHYYYPYCTNEKGRPAGLSNLPLVRSLVNGGVKRRCSVAQRWLGKVSSSPTVPKYVK